MTEDTFDRRTYLERLGAGLAAASIGTVPAVGAPGSRPGFPPEKHMGAESTAGGDGR